MLKVPLILNVALAAGGAGFQSVRAGWKACPAGLAAGLLALIVLACGPVQAPTGGPGAQTQLQPKRGGVFHVPVPET